MQLNRSLGLFSLIFYGVGMILGAGIYSVIGKAAAPAQETLWISFILAAVVVILTALSYAELGTLFPKAGAEFVYIKKAFPKHEWMAIATGLLVAFSGMATAATVALAFGGYVNSFTEVSLYLTAFAVLLVFTVVNMIGMQESSWLNVIFTLIEVGGLGLFIYMGVSHEKFGDALSHLPTMGTLTGSALIIFAFFGFENIVALSEEVKDPEKNIPRAILISLAICTTMYIVVSLAALALMEPDDLAKSQAVMSDATKKESPVISRVLGAIALFSTANTALISLVSTSRVLFGMARDKGLPKLLSKVSSRKTPWVAALFAGGVACVLATLGQVEIVAGVSSFTTMVIFLLINLALISLRYRDPKLKRPFTVPFNLGKLSLPAALAALLCAIFLFQFTAQIYTIGFAVIAVCTAFGVWWQCRTG